MLLFYQIYLNNHSLVSFISYAKNEYEYELYSLLRYLKIQINGQINNVIVNENVLMFDISGHKMINGIFFFYKKHVFKK